MNTVTHLLVGWALAEGFKLEKRERTALTLAAVAPDIDGLGVIAERMTLNSAHTLYWYEDYHHVLAHNLLFALVMAAGFWMSFGRRWRMSALALLTVHVHLLGDLISGRGPDGYQWPVPYLAPFSPMEFSWSGQWELDAWPNYVVTIVLMAVTFYLAWKRGYSPVGIISERSDRAFVLTLRERFKVGE